MNLKKSDRMANHQHLQKAKSFEDLDEFVGRLWNGEEEMHAIEESLAKRINGHLYPLDPPPPRATQEAMEQELVNNPLHSAEPAEYGSTETMKSVVGKVFNQSGETTPTESKNPEPVTTNAPLMPSARDRLMKPALISGEDAPTPSPTPTPERAACV